MTRGQGSAPMTSSRAVRLVAKREIREGGRRAAVITGGVAALVIVVAVVVPLLADDDDATELGVVAGVDVDEPALRAGAAAFDLDLEFTELADVAAAEAAVTDGEVDAALTGPTELLVEADRGPGEAVGGQTLQAALRSVIAQETIVERFGELGVGPQQTREALAATDVLDVRTVGEATESGAFFLALGGTVLLLMGITFFGSQVLTGVVQEKSSRVVEVVLGTMRPWQLLAGKLAGIGTLALGQVVILVTVILVALGTSGTFELPDGGAGTVTAVFVWFVLGFAIYSVLYAAAGAMVNRLEDAQSTLLPVTVLLFAAYGAVFFLVLPDPDTIASRVVSMLPGLAPLAMPPRVALGSATVVEQVVAVLASVVATALAVRLAGRIYERSILRTTQASWREALRRDPAAS